MSSGRLRLSHALALLPLATAILAGCAPTGDDATSGAEAITHVPNTSVESQAIGNCWLYATGAWAESMHLAATGEAFDVSQSYWSYWHWFEQISDEAGAVGVRTGGTYDEVRMLAARYGLIAADDFVPGDLIGDQSQRQSDALVAIRQSLASGPLSSPATRKDRRAVRAELDKAWQLPDETKALLDRVFGDDVARRFDTQGRLATPEGTAVLRTSDFVVQYSKRPGAAPTHTTLAMAFKEWQDVFYSTQDHRSFQIRVQRALHDGMALPISWFADLNALDRNPTSPTRGTFSPETLAASDRKAVRGFHLTVLTDYQVKTAKFGVLAAGAPLDASNPEDAQKLAAALQPDSVIELFRVKNSWGTNRPDRPSLPSAPGYFHLSMRYLDDHIPDCDDPNATRCEKVSPLEYVLLPPGY